MSSLVQFISTLTALAALGMAGVAMAKAIGERPRIRADVMKVIQDQAHGEINRLQARITTMEAEITALDAERDMLRDHLTTTKDALAAVRKELAAAVEATHAIRAEANALTRQNRILIAHDQEREQWLAEFYRTEYPDGKRPPPPPYTVERP